MSHTPSGCHCSSDNPVPFPTSPTATGGHCKNKQHCVSPSFLILQQYLPPLNENPVSLAWPEKAPPELTLPSSPCHTGLFLLPKLIPTSGPLHQLYPWPRMLLPWIIL